MRESAAKMKVGIPGVGAIGHALAIAIDQNRVHAQLAAVSDQDREKALTSMADLRRQAPVVSIEELVECSDLVVEAASQIAVRNPRTSRLAALFALAALTNLTEPLRLGT